MATDPVCGMTVDAKTATNTEVHNGATYFFCSPHCRQTFQAHPSAYVPPA
jgi:YHS domain-containing protein